MEHEAEATGMLTTPDRLAPRLALLSACFEWLLRFSRRVFSLSPLLSLYSLSPVLALCHALSFKCCDCRLAQSVHSDTAAERS